MRQLHPPLGGACAGIVPGRDFLQGALYSDTLIARQHLRPCKVLHGALCQ
jgi:hypothetical protein